MARKTWITIGGWLLVIVGLAAIPLPGPGLLILLSGLVVLSQEYEWAEKRVEPVRKKAIEGAKDSVATWPRIVMAALFATGILAVGVWVWSDPDVPEFWVVGPKLPLGLGGWPTGSTIIFSGLIAWGILIYSLKVYRPEALKERENA